jgi:23S rRNA pseudouridine1911/1915/1917 synthase
VQKRIDSNFGKFTLLEMRIDTGRTHQIRVHLASLRHPVVGDALYGAPREMRAKNEAPISLPRNFLHAAALQFQHPRSGEALSFTRPLPEELRRFLGTIGTI